jgi:L,D-transpeptidase YcbB
MDKRLLTVAAAVAALAVLAPASHADKPFKKKHLSFFESLFGTTEDRAARAERRRQEALQRRQFWLQDNGYVFGRPVRPNAYGKPVAGKKVAAKVLPIYEDPEPIPGFGYGNVAFVLPRMVPVADAGLAQLPASGLDDESVRVVLSDRQSPVKADVKMRDAVLGFYKSRNFAPVWVKDGKLTESAKTLVGVLGNAQADGLDPQRYVPAGFDSLTGLEAQIEGSSISAAQLDVALTVSAASYAQHLSGGAFEPNKLSLYNDVHPEGVEPAVALRVLAYTPFPQKYLESLAPKLPAYGLLKAELQKLDAGAAAKQDPFPAGKRVKVGQSDSRIATLRDRLQVEGLYDPLANPVLPGKEEVLDKDLSAALKGFQARNSLPQTGALDQSTVTAFNTDNTATKREKIISNLERIRWLPKSMGMDGRRYVFVNQAAFEVKVMDKGQAQWTSRVIVGKPTTQTAVFDDEMETVVFNPTWGLPASIIVNEYLGKLRRDPGYFDRIGFQVVNANGKKVSSRSVSWGSVGANPGFSVIQPPGDSNALGELKFLFPNSHDIYMHDTPNRNLFASDVRAFSHGCVRVQDPREFAKVVLGLTDADVEARLAGGETENVRLPTKLPVHLTYFTAWPDDSGNIRYYSDIYERDKTLEGARAIVSRAFGGVSSVKIVQASAKLQGAQAD